MNSNVDYERFTQEIYQTLINFQGINTIEVQHNVKLKGKSGQEHQIDVYWEYKLAGIIHKVVIECKNYSNSVSIGKVRDFYGVLSDLNNVNGIIVTKVGYQAGAKKYAQHHGINLKELRIPKNEDWNGRIKSIDFQISIITTNIKKRIPIIDFNWIRENLVLPESGQLTYSLKGHTDEIYVKNELGDQITNFYELDSNLPVSKENQIDIEHVYSFENAYLDLNPMGLVKIAGIRYIYDVQCGVEGFSIDSIETTKAILKDALTDEIKFFDKKGNIK